MAEETTAPTAEVVQEPAAEAAKEPAAGADPSIGERLAGLFKGRGPVRSSVARREDAAAEREQAAAVEAAEVEAAKVAADDDDPDDDGADDDAGEGDGGGDGDDTGRPRRSSHDRNKRRRDQNRKARDSLAAKDLEIARLQGRNEALQEVRGTGAGAGAGSANGTGAEPAAPAEDVEPQAEDFETMAEYVKAQARYEVKQEMAAAAAEVKVEKERLTKQTEHVQLVESWDKQLDQGRERWQDFEAVALSPDVPYSQAMFERITHSDLGAEIAYHLGRNPQEAARLAQQDPQATREALAVMEADIRAGRIAFPDKTNTQGDVAAGEPGATATPTAAAAGAGAEATRRPRAAAPPSEVRGSERPEPNMERLAKENPGEYARVRNKQRAAARER